MDIQERVERAALKAQDVAWQAFKAEIGGAVEVDEFGLQLEWHTFDGETVGSR